MLVHHLVCWILALFSVIYEVTALYDDGGNVFWDPTYETELFGVTAASSPQITEAPHGELVKHQLQERAVMNTCSEWSILNGNGAQPECVSPMTCIFDQAAYWERCGIPGSTYVWSTACYNYPTSWIGAVSPLDVAYCPSTLPACQRWDFIQSGKTWINFGCATSNLWFTVVPTGSAPSTIPTPSPTPTPTPSPSPSPSPSPTPSPTPPSSRTSPSPNPPSSSSTTFTTSTTTPIPSTTTTPTPVPTTTPIPDNGGGGNGGGGGGPPLAEVIGGSVGGFATLVLAIIGIVKFVHWWKNKDKKTY